MNLILKKILALNNLILIIHITLFASEIQIPDINNLNRLPRELKNMILEQEITDLDWNTPQEIVGSLNTLIVRWPNNILRLILLNNALLRLGVNLNMINQRPYDEERALFLSIPGSSDNDNDSESGENIQLMTPIIFAAAQNMTPIVRFLIGSNININHKDQTGKSALMYAFLNHNNAMIELFIDAGANINQLLIDAARNDKIDVIRSLFLINLHIDVDHQDFRGNTALIYAYENNNKEIIRLLLEFGANLEQIKNYIVTTYTSKYTPLYSEIGTMTARTQVIEELFNNFIEWIRNDEIDFMPQLL